MFIVIDIGGTYARVARLKKRSVEFKEIRKIAVKNNYKTDLRSIFSLIDSFGVKKIKGIAVSVAGRLVDNGRLKISPNLNSWNNADLAGDIKKRYSCPVILVNDACAAALGEAIASNKKNNEFVLLVWGSGIGGARIKKIGDSIILDSFEPGHQVMNFTKKKCHCGQRGCLELSCGGLGIKDTYQKKASEIKAKEWREVLERFSLGLANIFTIYPTDTVIFTGGVAVNQTKKVRELHSLVKDKMKMVSPPKNFYVSKLKDNTGLCGAAYLLINNK